MASQHEENQLQGDPEYITYLLDQMGEFDWHFIVGSGIHNTPVERIGVVKKMLLAHSQVFRVEALETGLKEINDILPDTFKNLLRYVYGFNNTASLNFDDANALLYAADKFIMENLMGCVASRLMELISYENICSLMNNQACYRMLDLKSAITHILQFETKQVLASPQFLDMSPEAFLQILEQDQLEVPEIQLWYSAVQWAKNKAHSDEGLILREELTILLPHIRVCTLSMADFCQYITPARILTDSEVVEVCSYLGNNNYTLDLPHLCVITQPRTLTIKGSTSSELTLDIYSNEESYWACESCFRISTRDLAVQLCSIGLFERNNSLLDCRVTFDLITCSEKPSCSISVSALAEEPNYAVVFPISSDDEKISIVLQPNSNYAVTLQSEVAFSVFHNNDNTSSISGDHFIVSLPNHNGYYTSCFKNIKYKIISP